MHCLELRAAFLLESRCNFSNHQPFYYRLMISFSRRTLQCKYSWWLSTFLPLYFKRNLVEAAENVFNSAAWKLMDSWPSILFNLPKSCTCRSVSLPFPSIILLFPFLSDMGMIMLLKFSHPCVSNLYNKYKMHSHQAINSFNWRQAHLKFYLYICTKLLNVLKLQFSGLKDTKITFTPYTLYI